MYVFTPLLSVRRDPKDIGLIALDCEKEGGLSVRHEAFTVSLQDSCRIELTCS